MRRVALDVPLATLFDYALPPGLQVQAGDRVTSVRLTAARRRGARNRAHSECRRRG